MTGILVASLKKMDLNPIALKMAKTPSSFDHSECNRDNIFRGLNECLNLCSLGKAVIFVPIETWCVRALIRLV